MHIESKTPDDAQVIRRIWACRSTPALLYSRPAQPTRGAHISKIVKQKQERITYSTPIPLGRSLAVLLAAFAVREAEREILLCVGITQLGCCLEVAL